MNKPTEKERAAARKARAAEQAKRDAKALAHARANPVTAAERAALERAGLPNAIAF